MAVRRCSECGCHVCIGRTALFWVSHWSRRHGTRLHPDRPTPSSHHGMDGCHPTGKSGDSRGGAGALGKTCLQAQLSLCDILNPIHRLDISGLSLDYGSKFAPGRTNNAIGTRQLEPHAAMSRINCGRTIKLHHFALPHVSDTLQSHIFANLMKNALKGLSNGDAGRQKGFAISYRLSLLSR